MACQVPASSTAPMMPLHSATRSSCCLQKPYGLRRKFAELPVASSMALVMASSNNGLEFFMVQELIAQSFFIVHALSVLGEQNGIGAVLKVKRLTIVSNEPLEAWPTGARPHLNSAHHKRTRQAIKTKHRVTSHEKAPSFSKAKGNGKDLGVHCEHSVITTEACTLQIM